MGKLHIGNDHIQYREKIMGKLRYESFQPLENARLALNCLTSMVDKKLDHLPYWLVQCNAKPGYAEHCRVDDSEIVGSWYEAIVAVRQMLRTDEGREAEAAFRRHILKSWGEQGLRYHEPYPWSFTIHSSFHEMGYILSALNRMIENNPDDRKAEALAAQLVRGMRKLVIERKTRTFWSGDYPEPEAVYEFPNDVYIKDRGFDLTCHTGRGEQSIRNGVILYPLVNRYKAVGDEVALDLAIGQANYLLGVSRYFNYKMEFFGHVHSSVWVASGLVRLGRLIGEKRYIEKGRMIYDYVRSLSYSFGWVPEYSQWFPPEELFCETCCIKDMIECASELIDAGYEDYYDDMNRFARNQLIENQIRTSSFVVVDNSIEETELRTYRDIDKRIIGGFSGGSSPGGISLKRSNTIAGCCVGTAPQALQVFWNRSVDYSNGRITINMPVSKTIPQAEVTVGYPNEGYIRVKTNQACEIAIRLHPWMPKVLRSRLNGREKAVEREGNLAMFRNIPKDSEVELFHVLRSRKLKENVRGRAYITTWRGPDVVDISPHDEGIRLYQREEGRKKYRPSPTDASYTSGEAETISTD